MYSGRGQGKVSFRDELLVSLAVSGQNLVSFRLCADNGHNLITIPWKLAWREDNNQLDIIYKIDSQTG